MSRPPGALPGDDSPAGEPPPIRPAAGFAEGGVLDALEAGPALAEFSAEAMDAGLGELTDDELVGLLRAARRLSSWQAAVEFRAVAELDARRVREAERPRSSLVSEHVSAEIAMALTLTGRSADALLGLSRDLARLPSILAALSAGRIDRAKAVVFATELAGLGDVSAAAVAMAFCRIAGSMTTGQLRAALRSMVLWLDPKAARRRAEEARADARVEAWHEGSGNSGLAGRELPPAEVIAADKRIDAIAQTLKRAGAPGSMDQLRAAVFAALLTGRDPETLLPAADVMDGEGGRAAGDGPVFGSGARSGTAGAGAAGLAALTGSINLTMPVSAWLGQSEVAGEIAGFGPLDADTCRDLAARLALDQQTRWCVTLTRPDGRAAAHACARAGPGPRGSPAWLASLRFEWLQRGTCDHRRQASRYRPGGQLRELVKVRQRTCSFPGCRRPARACDDDHTIPYNQGGRTCECNLSSLCRRHHRVKQAPGWRLVQPSPGVLAWTTPSGRTYVTQPEPYPA